jgi:polyribonucleotide nucleotidyltransferase
MRTKVVNEGTRLDGRGLTDIRPLQIEVGMIDQAHGSAMFQRGETQVSNVTTMGMLRMEQMLDTISIEESKRYMHHYNFPPFSTGETGFMRGPKRREIGHGALAEKALLPVIPTADDFPYAYRLVSEVLMSNGSSSMASVCGSTMSLMDAGVPIESPVAGIAMGLIAHEGKYVTLTDILGAEDALGDMDFKVAGTRDMITALQLDTKIESLPAEVLISAMGQARDARLFILDAMADVLAEPRPELAPNAPKIEAIAIPKDRIGEVIGPKGKTIRELEEETGATIEIDDDGIVRVGAADTASMELARERILAIGFPPEAEVGKDYEGEVVNITKFGAFVNILPGRDGLLHISKMGGGRRIEQVEDVLSLGDKVNVVVREIDDRGKVSLELAEGVELEVREGAKTSSGGGGGDRGGRDRGGRDRGGRDRDRGDRDRGGRDRGGRDGGRNRDRGGRDRDRGRDRDQRTDKPGRTVVSFEDEFESGI